MPSITPEQLTQMAVSTVEDFLNNQVPLSEGLSKRAEDLGLNSDQIQRGVEAVNSITYLKVRSMSPDDRTVEFPLCKYAEVISHITVPRSDTSYLRSPAPELSDLLGGFSKAASDNSVDSEIEVPHRVKLQELNKQAAMNQRAIETLTVEGNQLAVDLVKLASEMSKDSQWMDKCASVMDKNDFQSTAILVTGSLQPYRDLKDTGLFKEASLAQANRMVQMLHKAASLKADIDRRSHLQKQAAELNEGLQKQAFISTIAKGVGVGLGAPIRGLSAGAGYVAGTPFRVAKGVMDKSTAAIRSKFRSDMKTPGTLNKVKATATAGKKIGGKVGGAVAAVGGAALDMTMYKPGFNARSNRSGDIWDALQKK